ncbi:MAG: TIGR00730 family Rossman fold protein [Acidobacteria bacterium]|nr:TIGR00730 family Rossman fold protein [Acidobacteriota bacterium]
MHRQATRGAICVFCGSSSGARPDYEHAARQLGEALVEHGYDLVYGGANVGLMATIADTVLDRGGRVTGVIPEALVQKEVAHRGVSELRVVASMHERKATMATLSVGFIALPGGLGTLEELFEVLTWAQLGLHAKPCGLLNVAGYYDRIVDFLDYAVSERFVKASHRSMMVVESEPEALLRRFLDYQAPVVDKWIDRKQT